MKHTKPYSPEVRERAVRTAQGICTPCPGETRPPTEAMAAFIDKHRDADGVEPICKRLNRSATAPRKSANIVETCKFQCLEKRLGKCVVVADR